MFQHHVPASEVYAAVEAPKGEFGVMTSWLLFSALCGHTDAKHNSAARGDRQQRTAGNLA